MSITTIQDTVLCFGKFSGKTIKQVYDEGNYDYLKYMAENAFTTNNQYKNLCQEAIKTFVTHKEELLQPYREQYRVFLLDNFKPILDCLKYYQIRRGLRGAPQSSFMQNMRDYIERGVLPPIGARSYIVDTAAKTKGRRNSNAYKQALSSFEELFVKAVDEEKNLLERLKAL